MGNVAITVIKVSAGIERRERLSMPLLDARLTLDKVCYKLFSASKWKIM